MRGARALGGAATLHSLALCRLAYRHWVRRILIVRPSFACAPVEPYVLGTPQSASRFAADRRFKTLRASPSRSTHRTGRDARGAGPLRGCSLFSAKRNDLTHCPDARGQQYRSGHGRLGRGGRNGGRFGIASLFYLCPGSSLGDCALHSGLALPERGWAERAHSRPDRQVLGAATGTNTTNGGINALHDVPSRLSRWLLQTSDKIGSDTIPFTHEFLGNMLGVRRSTVTQALSEFHAAGLLEGHRGQIMLLRRGELKKKACPCYEIVRRHIDRLVPYSNERSNGDGR